MIETIRVTKEDIQEANLRRDAEGYEPSCECPIAQAVRRVHPDWRVDARTLQTADDVIKLPIQAIWFIRKFDYEEPVEPFTFEIEV